MNDKTTDPHWTELDDMTAAILALMRFGVPTDIQELLIYGSPVTGTRPGALQAALVAAGVKNAGR